MLSKCRCPVCVASQLSCAAHHLLPVSSRQREGGCQWDWEVKQQSVHEPDHIALIAHWSLQIGNWSLHVGHSCTVTQYRQGHAQLNVHISTHACTNECKNIWARKRCKRDRIAPMQERYLARRVALTIVLLHAPCSECIFKYAYRVKTYSSDFA